MLGATVLVFVKQACLLVCLELRDDLSYFQSAQGSKTCRSCSLSAGECMIRPVRTVQHCGSTESPVVCWMARVLCCVSAPAVLC